MQRIRLRYTKRGRLRFTSHRDFQRAFERALRRAEVPMAYSAGFTPHPKVSYANAAPTGTGSEAEYLEIALTEHRDPEKLRELLDESMPAGLDIIDAVEARTSGLADRLTASVWELRLDGVELAEDAERAVAAFLAAETVEVQRRTKNGMRTFDAARRRGAAWRRVARSRLIGRWTMPCAILRLVVRHVTPAVRPDDVLSGLRAVADLAPPVPAAVTRLAQGLFDEESGTVTDPLAPDREAVPAAPPTAAGAAARDGAGRSRRVRMVVVAQPWYSGATWVGPRTDQKTFARPYATSRTEPASQDIQLPCGARAPDGGTAHITRAAAGPESGAAPGSVTGEPPACSNRTESGTAGDTENKAPSDNLPPRRRRRAASRPAGPPTGGRGRRGPPWRRGGAEVAARGRWRRPLRGRDAPRRVRAAVRPVRPTAPAGAPQAAEAAAPDVPPRDPP